MKSSYTGARRWLGYALARAARRSDRVIPEFQLTLDPVSTMAVGEFEDTGFLEENLELIDDHIAAEVVWRGFVDDAEPW
jgi:hypothetical protein